MAKTANQKLRLLVLLRIFEERTDEAHPLTLQQLSELLAAQGFVADRKTLYDDIEALRMFGADILMERGRRSVYYMANRRFQLPELKLLVDSVQSSKFITERKTLELIRKIEGLASIYDAQLLQRQVFVQGRIKGMNESVYYNVDEISAAIAADSRISFLYFELDLTKRRRYRRSGERYVASPFALIWDNENYYLLAFDHKSRELRHYRVDRMVSIRPLEEKREGAELFRQLDMSSYGKKVFSMFGGSEQRVTLRFRAHLVGAVVDRFGSDIPILPDGDDHFTTSVAAVVSEPFFGWLLSFGGEAELLGPPDVREQLRKQLESISAQYEALPESGNS